MNADAILTRLEKLRDGWANGECGCLPGHGDDEVRTGLMYGDRVRAQLDAAIADIRQMLTAVPDEADCPNCSGCGFTTRPSVDPQAGPIKVSCDMCQGVGRIRFRPEADDAR